MCTFPAVGFQSSRKFKSVKISEFLLNHSEFPAWRGLKIFVLLLKLIPQPLIG
ncbi:hypothetical protein Cabys_169 [Caldithrix abyssi DSM 13497]|uniref:Uncharacterized protein n=1 Tax=Caldithrix abyssi DSM 13497 TaxID=880073 RepID=A0A1J1C4V3_CALAY|nr:hypothetical protein Cabys_169 [Caldithrix abyssi DSM 13497]